MMRLAKFLVSHSEFEWIYQAQDVPEKYVVLETQTGQARSHVGARQEHLNRTTSHRIQLLDTARHCSLERGGRAVCYRTCGSERVAVSPVVG